MNRAFILLLLLLSAVLPLSAQSLDETLTFERINSGTEIFSNKENWSEIIIQSKEDYYPVFSIPGMKILDLSASPTSIGLLDKNASKAKAILAKKSTSAQGTEYTLWIRVKEGDEPPCLTINPGIQGITGKVTIPLDGLQPKERIRFRLYNPLDADDGSVFQQHNVRGKELFNDCNYAAARQEFVLASYCEASPQEKEKVREMMANCDSIMMYTKIIEEYTNKEQWADALRVIRKTSKYNPNDRYLINIYQYNRKKLLNQSNTLLAEAQDLYDNGNYHEAKRLYDRVAEFNGPLSDLARKRSEQCDKEFVMKSNRERYIGFEFGMGNHQTFGITHGKYGSRTSSYQSWRINSDIFNLLRLRFNLNEHARFDATPLSIAFPVYNKGSEVFRGVWLNMGVGFTAVNKFKPKDKFLDWAIDEGLAADADGVTQEMVEEYLQYTESKRSSDALKPDIKFALNPEIGCVVKIWEFGIRLTYRQYINLNRGITPYIGRNQFSIGIGYCY